LADGSKRAGELTSDTKAGDLDYVAERFLEKGYDVTYKSDGKSFYVRGFTGKLRYAGLLSNKHIPEKYFFSSIGQRLELVRGLLDQDGSIDENGSIEFTQSADHEPIMRGMVRLLRSLGIVVHEPTRSKAGYTLDGEHHDTQDRLRLTFTTNLPVFALERKRMLLPKTLRETQQWMYIKDIRKVEDVPCRCITVGSPDHTYLVNDYVPTHNTMAAFSLFLQWSKIDARDGKGKTPCIYINPKAGNDLEDATRSQGGTVIRLDSDVANGTFDPFNVIPNVEEAKEIAVLMMTNILGGDTKMESAMTAMLDYGVKHGARCVGRALLVAAQAVAKTIKAGNTAESIGLPSNTLEVFSTINMNLKANQGLRLIFGTDNDTKPLTISQNLTLINAGDRSLIPEGQDDSMTARIRQWTLRMVVMGAGTAVRGRDGMVGVDEAWVFMGKDKGASRTFEQWVRMARSQRFTPVIISQKVQEFIDADLTGGISRALLLALDNPEEANGTVSPAKSAERLLGIEDPNGRILQRMGADDTLDNGQPNPNSLKRLVSASTGKTVRGAVAYFKDGSKQPIPVEIVIPPALLKEISTTATDKIAREQRKNKEQ
ncbi:ATP-binding protein, partial [Bifidobacterium longum]